MLQFLLGLVQDKWDGQAAIYMVTHRRIKSLFSFRRGLCSKLRPDDRQYVHEGLLILIVDLFLGFCWRNPFELALLLEADQYISDQFPLLVFAVVALVIVFAAYTRILR
jgi:hypothetical protein